MPSAWGVRSGSASAMPVRGPMCWAFWITPVPCVCFGACIVTDIVYLYRCVCLPPPSVRMTSNCSLSEEVVPTEALSLNGVSESAVHRSSFPLFPVISKVA